MISIDCFADRIEIGNPSPLGLALGCGPLSRQLLSFVLIFLLFFGCAEPVRRAPRDFSPLSKKLGVEPGRKDFAASRPPEPLPLIKKSQSEAKQVASKVLSEESAGDEPPSIEGVPALAEEISEEGEEELLEIAPSELLWDYEESLAEAMELEEAEELDDALILFEKAASMDVSDISAAVLGKARVLLKTGQFEAALDVLGEPDESFTPESWLIRAGALEALGENHEAVIAYSTAVGETGEDAVEYVAARIHQVLEKMTGAELEEVAEACPLCAEGGFARFELAKAAAREGRQSEAAEILRNLEADFSMGPLGVLARRLKMDIASTKTARQGLYGLLLPLSGPLKSFGARALRGAVLGSRLLSGEEDPNIRLTVIDSKGDDATAAAAVELFAERGVMGIVGPLKGSVAAKAAETARSLGIPMITPTPLEGLSGEGVFRLCLREEDEVAKLVEYAMDVLGLTRFAILHPDTEAGLRYRNLFWREAVDRGAEITGVEAYFADAKNVGDSIEKLTGVFNLGKDEIRERFVEEEKLRMRRENDLFSALGMVSNAQGGQEEVEVDKERLAEYKVKPTVDFDAVFLPASSLDAAQIAPQFPFHDVEGVTLLGIRSWNYETLVQVGEEYVEGAVFPAEMHLDLPVAREFAKEYQESYGELPGVMEAYVFDALSILVDASSFMPMESRDSLKKHLSSLWAAQGATGPFTSHPDGQIAAEPKILTVRRGKIRPVH